MTTTNLQDLRVVPITYSGGGCEDTKSRKEDDVRPGQGGAEDIPPEDIREDAKERLFWVFSNGYILFEFWKLPEDVRRPVSEFLVAISEPISRPKYVHEYQITFVSLYSAIALGMTGNEILHTLQEFSKNWLSHGLANYIRSCGARLGRVKLVLRNQRYFVEAASKSDLIAFRDSTETRQYFPGGVQSLSGNRSWYLELDARLVNTTDIEELKKKAYKAQYPLLEEYEFEDSRLASRYTEGINSGPDTSSPEEEAEGYRVDADKFYQSKRTRVEASLGVLNEDGDPVDPSLPIRPRQATAVRDYQEKSLHKMFHGGRARSGIIVLPCGAGKTLVGILATATVRKRTLVLTSTSVAVDQWKRQFELFTSVNPDDVITFTSEGKKVVPSDRAVILVCTYSMLGRSHEKMSRESQMVVESIKRLNWGLLVCDEVQVMPANTFRQVASTVRCHSKLGLTATLVREDGAIEDLQYLIGPKLYEANWTELQDQGYIAKVRCIEVWCPMTSDFYLELLKQNQRPGSHRTQQALYCSNPNKLLICEYLIREHQARGDKIIIFCDSIPLLNLVSKELHIPRISGEIGMQERMSIIHAFKTSSAINCILLSQVGDNAIDIPNANVVIQISSHYGSRRQEAQRLGRILRPKTQRDSDGFNAYFYSLISKDTSEKLYAEKRQRFLVEQGYAFTVVSDLLDRVKKEEGGQRGRGGEIFRFSSLGLQKELMKVALGQVGRVALPPSEGVEEGEEGELKLIDGSMTAEELQKATKRCEERWLGGNVLRGQGSLTHLADLTGGGKQGGHLAGF